MPVNLNFQRVDGTAVVIDIETVTAIAAMPLADLLRLNLSQGTRVTHGGVITDIVESQNLLEALVRPLNIAGGITVGAVSASEVFNAAGPTATAATVVAPASGSYLLTASGGIRTTDAAATGCTVQPRVNGAPSGTVLNLPVGAFTANGATDHGLDEIGPTLVSLLAGQSCQLLIGVTPGGVPGDDIEILGVQLSLERVT